MWLAFLLIVKIFLHSFSTTQILWRISLNGKISAHENVIAKFLAMRN